MLEQIVKVYVPFAGNFKRNGFDKKGRTTLPSDLVITLMDRQRVEQRGKVVLYYTLHIDETPKFIELTDYFQEGDNVDFSLYGRVYLNSQSRILIPQSDDFEKVGIKNGESIVFEGAGHSIYIYSAKDF